MFKAIQVAGWGLICAIALSACGGGAGGLGSIGVPSSSSSSAASSTASSSIASSSSSSSLSYNKWFPGTVGHTMNYRTTSTSGGAINTFSATVISSNAAGFSLKSISDNAPTNYGVTDYTYEGSALSYSGTRTYNATTHALTDIATLSPSGLVVPTSMSAGAVESTTSTSVGGGSMDTVIRSITVNGIESVTVPAGIFAATKITLTITRSPNAGGSPTTSTTTYWYAENIGRVKYTSATSTTELLSYSPGGGSSSSSSSSSNSSSLAPVVNTWFPATMGKVATYQFTSTTTAIPSHTLTSSVIAADSFGFSVRSDQSNSPTDYGVTHYIYAGTGLNYDTSQRFNVSTGKLFVSTTHSPAAIVLPSSMTTGTSESTMSYPASSGTVSGLVTRNVTVNGVESVTVPAGTFLATKVTLTSTTTGSTSTGTIVYWYVENIGRVKYTNSSGTTELVSYN